MENHFASSRIDDDFVACACALVEITQTDDGSKTKTSRNDRHVRSPATSIGGDCFDVIQVEFGDRRRQKILAQRSPHLPTDLDRCDLRQSDSRAAAE